MTKFRDTCQVDSLKLDTSHELRFAIVIDRNNCPVALDVREFQRIHGEDGTKKFVATKKGLRIEIARKSAFMRGIEKLDRTVRLLDG